MISHPVYGLTIINAAIAWVTVAHSLKPSAIDWRKMKESAAIWTRSSARNALQTITDFLYWRAHQPFFALYDAPQISISPVPGAQQAQYSAYAQFWFTNNLSVEAVVKPPTIYLSQRKSFWDHVKTPIACLDSQAPRLPKRGGTPSAFLVRFGSPIGNEPIDFNGPYRWRLSGWSVDYVRNSRSYTHKLPDYKGRLAPRK